MNFKAQSVFFASPLKFNDPYDCAINAGVQELTAEDVEALREYYSGRADAPEAVRNQFGSAAPDQLKDIFTRNLLQTIRTQREQFLRARGVCCFSENNDNLLMWAHYGGCYQGMCLEFRTAFSPFNKIKPVKYTEIMPSINLLPVAIEQDASQILEGLFCTKSHFWAYEKEWRCFHAEADTLFGYPPEALKAVYFGPNIDQAMRDLVCIILTCQNPKVELWIGERDQTQFKVDFELRTYTPHVAARMQGLL